MPEAPEPAHIEVLALEGIPEINVGDDLPQLVLAALEATPTALPARPDDVLVVTQKVVSKAEGAVADLTTVEPRPEAVAFAERWDPLRATSPTSSGNAHNQFAYQGRNCTGFIASCW